MTENNEVKNKAMSKEFLVVGVVIIGALLILCGIFLFGKNNEKISVDHKLNNLISVNKELEEIKSEINKLKSKSSLEVSDVKPIIKKIEDLENKTNDENTKEKLKKLKSILLSQKNDIEEAINIIDSILNENEQNVDIMKKYQTQINKVISYLSRNSEALSGANLTFNLVSVKEVPNYLVLTINWNLKKNQTKKGNFTILEDKNGNYVLFGAIIPTKEMNLTGSPDEIVNKLIKKSLSRFPKNMSVSAKIINTSEKDGLLEYLVEVKINNQSQVSPIIITKDGSYLIGMYRKLDLSKDLPKPKPYEPPKQKPIPKTDKPNIELFVMSYCPYGLQMEKAMLPVIDLLKDKANFTIKFVDYSMHGEKEVKENLLQYCLQKIDKDKYFKYLKCFVYSGNSSSCLDEVGFDMDKVNKCINETDEKYNVTYNLEHKTGYFPKFLVNEKSNQQYGVQGSPTTIINGVEYVGARSPESIKEAICNAFNEKPEECNINLSKESTYPGFGEGVKGAGSASCGA